VLNAVAHRFRTRLLPALLTAFGVALLANGLLTYTTAVEPGPSALPLASYRPLPTINSDVRLPNGSIKPDASFPPDRVAMRIVIPKLQIDLPVMLQTPNYGEFPLCDVALYQPLLGQPGQGRATYIYAHARDGMFLPLLIASQDNNGQRMIGYVVEVFTSDNYVFIYTIAEVHRHVKDLSAAFAATTERLWLQTSEGPYSNAPKLQVVANFLSASKTDPASAHPAAHPRICV
jgi:hypothetical protein